MKKFYIFFGVLSVVIRWSMCSSDYEIDGYGTIASAQFCSDLNPQRNLDMSQITGIWYGSVILEHMNSIKGEMLVDSCVTIDLNETTHEMTTPSSSDTDTPHKNSDRNIPNQYNYLRLVWEEKGTVLEDSLRYNEARRGFWVSLPLNDSLHNSQYTQSTGTIQKKNRVIQVMKAVEDHMVLYFCVWEEHQHQVIPKELFSLIFSRKPNTTLPVDDVQSVINLLKRRGLSTSSIRKVCVAGSASTVQIAFSTALLLALTLMLH